VQNCKRQRKTAFSGTLLLAAGFLLSVSGCGLKSAATAPGRWFENLKPANGAAPARAERKSRRPASATVHKRARRQDLDYVVDLMNRQKFKDALEAVESYLKTQPRHAEAYSLRGDCLYQLLRFDEAITSYQAARQIDPNYYPALRGLGFVELNIGRKQEKEEHLQEAFDHYRASLGLLRRAAGILPGDMKVIFGQAYAAEGAGNYFYARAVNLQRIRNDIQGAETMRDRALELYEEALAATRKYGKRNGRQIEPHRLMATLYTRVGMLQQEFGRTEQARRSIRAAMLSWQTILRQINPKYDPAQKGLDNCAAMLEKMGGDLKMNPGGAEIMRSK
jgi:tetratricopeptide (TPR) repeat protein